MFYIQKNPAAKMILTDEIKEYLLSHYERNTVHKMSVELSVSRRKVCVWLGEMGIKKTRAYIVNETPDTGEFFKHDINLVTI